MNQIQIAFCDKVNKEYFSERQRLCRAIIDICPDLPPMVMSQKDELGVLEISKQLALIDVIRGALLNACQRQSLTTNQMSHLIAVEGLIDKVSQKWNTQNDTVEKEVADAAREVEAENEESRKTQNRRWNERIPLI